MGIAVLYTTVLFVLLACLSVASLGRLAVPLTNGWPAWWGRSVLYILGIELTVTGREHLGREASVVLVVNHTSALDVPIVAALGPPNPLCLAKAELRWVPPFNMMWWSLGQVFLERGNPEQARRSIARVVEAARRRPRTIVLSPEGTRSRDGRVGRFKLGAFRIAAATGAGIVPAVCRGAGERMPPGRWWATPGRVSVAIMPPLPAQEWTEEGLVRAAGELEARYRRWLEEGATPAAET